MEFLYWFGRIERKLGKYSIKNLMLYITALNCATALLSIVLSQTEMSNTIMMNLMLIPSLVMHGEVWRLVTFLFIPPTTSPLWLLFTLYFYYMVGNTLEHEWGSFKFDLYYLIGVLGTIGATFLTGGIGTSVFLNFSLIFAFSYLFPNYQIMIFFFIPIKMKYLSLAYAVLLIYMFRGDLLYGLITVGGSVLNFLLFFGKDIIIRLSTGRKAYYNRRSYEAKIPKDITIHKCTVCGRTEKDDKNLEFRYCSECRGDYEYCMEHLYTHKHVGEADK